jgi:hypothetical protein
LEDGNARGSEARGSFEVDGLSAPNLDVVENLTLLRWGSLLNESTRRLGGRYIASGGEKVRKQVKMIGREGVS